MLECWGIGVLACWVVEQDSDPAERCNCWRAGEAAERRPPVRNIACHSDEGCEAEVLGYWGVEQDSDPANARLYWRVAVLNQPKSR